MPCKHSLCMPCYKQVVEKANLCCPLCRLRISVWARKSSKMNCLIDVAKWDAVRSAFPEEVQNRLEGKEDLSFDNSDDADDDEKRMIAFFSFLFISIISSASFVMLVYAKLFFFFQSGFS